MTEKNLYQQLVTTVTALAGKDPYHIQRIETLTGRGVPDVEVCFRGRLFWLELKAGTSDPLLRPEQYAWIRRRHRCGGGVAVLLYNAKGYQLWTNPSKWQIVPIIDKVKLISPPDVLAMNMREVVQALTAPINPLDQPLLTLE